MGTNTAEIIYDCSYDCKMSGCPGHPGKLEYQRTADHYRFYMDGRQLDFSMGEIAAMVNLLEMVGELRSLITWGNHEK